MAGEINHPNQIPRFSELPRRGQLPRGDRHFGWGGPTSWGTSVACLLWRTSWDVPKFQHQLARTGSYCITVRSSLLRFFPGQGNLRCVVDGTSSWLRTCSILGGESLRGWKIGRWKNLTSFNSVQMRYPIYPQIRRNRLRLANEHGAQEPKMWKPELHLSFRSEFKDRSKVARLIQQKWKHLVFRILQKVGVCDIPAPTKIQQHQILPLALQPHLVWWFGFPLADLGVFGRILAKAGPSGRRILPPFFGGGSNKAKMFVLGIFPE